jgi:hypothetical protein
MSARSRSRTRGSAPRSPSRPDATTLPTAISGNVTARFCLRERHRAGHQLVQHRVQDAAARPHVHPPVLPGQAHGPRQHAGHPAQPPAALGSERDLLDHYERLGRQPGSPKTEAARAQVLWEIHRREAIARQREARAEHQAVIRQRRRERWESQRGAERMEHESVLASRELLDRWQTQPRPTAAHFEGRDTRLHERYTERQLRRGQQAAAPLTSPSAATVTTRSSPPDGCISIPSPARSGFASPPS